LLYVGAAFFVILLNRSTIPESINLILYDFVISTRPSRHGGADPIAIIGISEDDLRKLGWPIDDRYLCEAITKLLDNGSIAIGLDLYRDQGIGTNQRCLRDLFRTNSKLISIFNEAEQIPAIPGTPPERQAYNDLVIDHDATVRRDLVHVAGQEDPRLVAFPMRLLEVANGSNQLRMQLEADLQHGQEWLSESSGGYRSTDAGGLQQMLPFRTLGSYPMWSLSDILNGNISASEIKGKVFLIGTTAPSLRDLFSVPHTRFLQSKDIQNKTSGEQHASQFQVSGVEIHAHRLSSLFDRAASQNHRLIRTSPYWLTLLIEVLAAFFGIYLGNSFHAIRRSFLNVMLATGFVLVVGFALLYFGSYWMAITLPCIALLLMSTVAWIQRGTLSQQHREQIERLLGQATSPEVAMKLWENRDDLLSEGRFEGRQLLVTVMFSDIASFTTVSEGMLPSELLNWINRGMRECISSIVRAGGIVNKFTGDGFLAAFGAPAGHGAQEDACYAVNVALEIATHLNRLNIELKAEDKPAMRLRIGIHTGMAIAGSMGGTERLEYCIMGDAVNCASRLESIDKHRHEGICRILISGETKKLIDPTLTELSWEEWGSMHLKGRVEPIQIWELKGMSTQSSVSPNPLKPLKVSGT
jgi:adenylate cyclase